jgi:endosialidase-like protein
LRVRIAWVRSFEQPYEWKEKEVGMKKSTLSGFWVAAVLAMGLLAIPAGAAGPAPLAVTNISPVGLEWQPAIQYEKIVLTVAGPGDLILRREFAAGVTPAFEAFADGKPLPDGTYTFELVASPVLDRETRQELARARQTGDDSILSKLRTEGKLPRGPLTQAGSFQVRNGAVVAQDLSEAPAPQAPRPGKPGSSGLLKDVVTPDDSIIQGSLCVGLDCVNNESFGFDTIRLKENNTRIKFDDTSSSVGFPANDWQLTANDSASGGSSKFSIEDITGAKVPFTVTAGAATNSIFVDSTGRVGLRTSTPVLDLHIATSNTPAIRLEQNNSGGFTAQTWDIAGNEANFFVRDVTGGSRLPFRIRPGAPTSSIDISADGDVGVGTASPEAKLHVFSANTADAFICMGPNCDGSPGTESALNIGYGGASGGRGAAFFNVRPDSGAVAPNPSMQFATANITRLVIDNNGDIGIHCNDPASDLVVASSASGTNCPVPSSSMNAGDAQFTVASSRTFKENLTPVKVPGILEKIASVDVYAYDFIDGPKDRIGLMAEDFHQIFGRGSDKYLNGNEVQVALWLAVQELTATNRELMKRLADLESRLPAGSTQK